MLPRVRCTTAPFSGDAPLRALDAAATRIAAGEEGVVLVTGAEATRAATGNRQRGVVPLMDAGRTAWSDGRPQLGERMAGAFAAGHRPRPRRVPALRQRVAGPRRCDARRRAAGVGGDVGGDVAGGARRTRTPGCVSASTSSTLLDTGPHNRPVVLPYEQAPHREPVREPGRGGARRRRRHRPSAGCAGGPVGARPRRGGCRRTRRPARGSRTTGTPRSRSH